MSATSSALRSCSPFDGRDVWDVVVIGAGPAGAIAARQLASTGYKVLLLDKGRFPRFKVCGGCLNGTALSVLNGCGLMSLPSLRQAPHLNELRLCFRRHMAAVRLRAGVAVARANFDADLVTTAIAAGANFLPEATASRTSVDGDVRITTVTTQGRRHHVSARVVVLASGLGGGSLQVAESIGFRTFRSPRIGFGAIFDEGPATYSKGVIYMSYTDEGYVGVVRLADGSLDVAAALTERHLKGGGRPDQLAARILERCGHRLPDAWPCAGWKGTPVLTQRPSRLGSERLFLAGDAAGYVEPFTGEGIGWALMSGYLVAEFAKRAVTGWDGQLVSQWEKLFARHVGRRQQLCYLLARALKSPRLAGTMMRGLAQFPQLARPMVGAVNAPFPFHTLAINRSSDRPTPTMKGSPS